MKSRLIIAAVLTAAALTAIFSTTTLPAFADESDINMKNKQSGAASGGGDTHNCAENNLDSVKNTIAGIAIPICSDVAVE